MIQQRDTATSHHANHHIWNNSRIQQNWQTPLSTECHSGNCGALSTTQM